MKSQVPVQDILRFIPEDTLVFFAKEPKVDWNSKKLTGKELFNLCIYGVLSQDRESSRVFESFYDNRFFCRHAGISEGKRVSHSSICERIGNVQVSYFEKLYGYTVETFKNKLGKKDKARLCLYDSTITSLSSLLLNFGMSNGQKNRKGQQGKHSVKFTIGFNGLPFEAKFHKEQKMISENGP
jgi:hypothetical protein